MSTSDQRKFGGTVGLLPAQLLQLVLDTIQPKVFWKDTDSVYLGCNQKFALVAGLDSPDSIVGLTDFDLPWTKEQAQFYRDCDRRVIDNNEPEIGIIESQTNSNGKLTWLETSKHPLLDASGSVIGILGSYHDITAIKEAEQSLQRSNEQLERSVQERTKELRYIAQHDSLTNLLNRHQFKETLADVIASKTPFAFLFIDLDRFKSVNDSLGHGVGDELLVQVSSILKQCIPGSIAGRFGGDEFTVLLSGLHSDQSAVDASNQIQEALRSSVIVDNSPMIVTASIGIVIDRNGDYCATSDVLRDADIAMYEAKRAGKACHQIFREHMLHKVKEQLTMENLIRSGLQNEEFFVVYQPILDLETGAVRSFEALVRWESPSQGLIMPDQFLGVAESTGLICDIGEQVLVQVCKQLSQWRRSHPCLTENLSIGVNLSAWQIRCDKFVHFIDATLAAYQMLPQDIDLEITESMLLDECGSNEQQLRILRERGHKLMLDDFGTGYSSLSYLHRFQVDGLKIDRSFISAIETDRSSMAIVKTIVGLADLLDLEVVAEGVETASQEAILKEVDCQQVQGFGYARPMTAAKALEFLKEPNTTKPSAGIPLLTGTNAVPSSSTSTR